MIDENNPLRKYNSRILRRLVSLPQESTYISYAKFIHRSFFLYNTFVMSQLHFLVWMVGKFMNLTQTAFDNEQILTYRMMYKTLLNQMFSHVVFDLPAFLLLSNINNLTNMICIMRRCITNKLPPFSRFIGPANRFI